MQGTVVVAGLLSLMLFAPNASYAQTPPKLEFEVASVRPSAPRAAGERPLPEKRSGGPGTNDPGRITYSNQPLNLILAEAFDVYWNRISGPDWIATERYDIVAKVPEGTTTREQARQMLQNLLVERFHLDFHMQTKVVQGYELTVAPGGSKLRESVDDLNDPSPAPQPDASLGRDKDGFPILPPGVRQRRRQAQGHVYARFADTPVSEFATFLSTLLSAGSMVMLGSGESRGAPTPILDNTGLTRRYDFTFDYAGSLFFGPNYLPDILSAIKSSLDKQLGLKLVDAKFPVNILVIDHVEKKPTED